MEITVRAKPLVSRRVRLPDAREIDRRVFAVGVKFEIAGGFAAMGGVRVSLEEARCVSEVQTSFRLAPMGIDRAEHQPLLLAIIHPTAGLQMGRYRQY